MRWRAAARLPVLNRSDELIQELWAQRFFSPFRRSRGQLDLAGLQTSASGSAEGLARRVIALTVVYAFCSKPAWIASSIAAMARRGFSRQWLLGL